MLTTTQPARIEAYETTPLLAKLAGYVGEVRVDIGDRVQRSDVLATLYIPELKNEAAQKEALVNRARAEVKQSAANLVAAGAAADTAHARVAEAEADVNRTNADIQRWTAEFTRIKQLAGSGSVTQKLVDETQSQLRAATASGEAASAAVKSAEAGAREAAALIAKAEADQAAAEARLKVAEADLARAKTLLDYASITAPFDGVVTQRSVDTGHFVQPAGGTGSKPLLVVARTDKVRVYCDVPEMEAAHVDVGDAVTLRVQALPGDEIRAAVARTSWSLDAANRSLRTEVDIPNDRAALRPGMYATAAIELARRENALTLPTAAIVRSDGTTSCCCVNEGKIERRQVELGLRSGSDVEVLSGVDEQSLVVLIRAESLTPGQRVQVISSAP
ncbi:MAG: efflux RND transporter periplasmic adaptor subunit [Pirellulales bacterium]|nr:efflux RND transporter periplasmic adaptor subunit [Pirellulales bacterium]